MNARCQLAQCGEEVTFAVRDGDGCLDSDELSEVTIDGVDGVQCARSGQLSCHWTIPTPQCPATNIAPVTAPQNPTIIIDNVPNDDGSTTNDDGSEQEIDDAP